MGMERKNFHTRNRLNKIKHMKDGSMKDILLPVIQDVKPIYSTEFIEEVNYSNLMLNDSDALYKVSENCYLDITTYDEPTWIVFLIDYSEKKLLLVDKDTGIIVSVLDSNKTFYKIVRYILKKNFYTLQNVKRVKAYLG